MKLILPAVFLFLLNTTTPSVAATADSIPAHLNNLKLPDFLLELPNGKKFFTEDLPKNKHTIIILFSPECDHCKNQTKALLERIKQFRNTQIVMTTTLPMDRMVAFYNEFGIQRFKNLVMGRDALFFFSRYYQSHFLPFTAVYNKKGELVSVYDGEVTIDTLLEQTQ